MADKQTKGTLNAAVIGTGNLGRHHARIYAGLDTVNLVGIVDTDTERCEAVAEQYATRGYRDYHDILDKVDMVSIAVPTSQHYTIGKEVLARGIHCLMEKPITAGLPEAEELVRLAKQHHTVLQVGHIEQFNPALCAARQYITSPNYIEAFRLSPYDPRIEVGVVLDVMIHDIDIILSLVKAKLSGIHALSGKVFTDNEDIVKVRMTFDNGCVADLSASRISPEKYRKMRIFQKDSYCSLDFLKQTLKVIRKKKQNAASMDDIEQFEPVPEKHEPLMKEIEHFIGCVREGKKPLVSGQEGCNAVKVAMDIINELKK